MQTTVGLLQTALRQDSNPDIIFQCFLSLPVEQKAPFQNNDAIKYRFVFPVENLKPFHRYHDQVRSDFQGYFLLKSMHHNLSHHQK